MKVRFKIILLFVTLLFLIFLGKKVIKSLAFFTASTVGVNNSFQTGEWIPAETKFLLKQNNLEYTNEESVTETNNNYQLEIKDNISQYLYFEYKLQSDETASLFDNPILLVKINENIVLQINDKSIDGEWENAFIDLSDLQLDDGTHSLTFEVQNTFDDLFYPIVEIKNVTTRNLLIKPSSQMNFFTSKGIASLFIEYTVTENNKEIVKVEEISSIDGEYIFNIPENLFGNEIKYWSKDLYDNIEEKKVISFEFVKLLAVSNFDFNVFKETDDELNLQFLYENKDNYAKYFIVKTSSSEINSTQDWESAQKLISVDHQKYNLNSVSTLSNIGTSKFNLVYIDNLQTQKYLSVKVCNVVKLCEFVLKNYYLE